MKRLVRRTIGVLLAWWAVAALPSSSALAAAPTPNGPNRFLAKADILLFGIGLKVDCPPRKGPNGEPIECGYTIPKDIAMIVSTFLQAPQIPEGLPPFAPDAVVSATLRGPTFPQGLDLTVRPNSPFNIPPLRPGKHTLENIRLISNGEVLLFGTPSTTVIDVIDKLLITEVTARPLTDAEIREKGIVYDRSSFQAFDFRVGFAIEDKKIPINLTVVLPSLRSAEGVSTEEVRLGGINTQPVLPTVQTVIPDTLRQLQTQIPNLSVVGFSLKVPELKGQNFFVPPIPGVVIIPGDIGFLNQFFSILLMVGNVAPEGSNLVVTNLRAEIVLPAGNDDVVGSGDDPLRMAETTAADPTPQEEQIRQPGADGKLGTADDIDDLGPGHSGNAEFLVEGRREGTHFVEFEIVGTLIGLPIGPVEVRGRAVGSVLVRNPSFTLTFTHPEIVTAGEKYALDVTITNSSETSPANQVSLNLHPRFISGATLVGEPLRTIDSILPGDSATVSFDLVANVTGKVTAATLESDSGGVNGRFSLKTSVGELGIPLTADSLVLPKEAGSVPKTLRDAALGLLGRAHAVATAPAAALPKDIARFSKAIVFNRAVEVAQAGLRISLREPVADSAAQLWMDFIGSDFGRLSSLNPKPEDLALARKDFSGFDELRRRSVRGDVLAQSVASLLADNLAAQGPAVFHQDVAQKISYRPGHISVLIGSAAGPLPFELTVVDGQQRRVGGRNASGKIAKEIPFSDYLVFADGAGATIGQMAILAAPEAGEFKIRLERMSGTPDDAAFDLSIVVPDAQGNLRHISFQSLTPAQSPVLAFDAGDPYRLSVEVLVHGQPHSGQPASAVTTVLPDPPPSIVGAVQQATADQVCVDPGKTEGLWRPGRIIAVLFSEEVTRESVQDKFKPDAITNYAPEANQVVGVALQPGRRVVFLGLRDGLGPFISPARTITISGVTDLAGQSMAAETAPVEITAEDQGGVVSGRVLHADGAPVAFASLRLFYPCENAAGDIVWIGISQKSADAEGRYSWDYVLAAPKVLAVDPETEEFREVQFRISRHGQRVNVDLVLLGRGTFEGRTLGEDGRPLANTAVRISSLTDSSQYGAMTDAAGRFTIARIPVGNIFVEAVNTAARAQFAVSDLIPFAGATTTRDIVLLTADSPKQITVRKGTVAGHVLRDQPDLPIAGLPVVVYYQHLSQEGVRCPGRGVAECAVAVGKTEADGGFAFKEVVAGELRIHTFDQAALQEGQARTILAADGAVDVNVAIAGGLGRVRGVVRDPDGNAVAGAVVGGGLSLATTNDAGEFLLVDVPLGLAREIVAVSQELGSRARVRVDLLRAGEEVPATLVLGALGSVAGAVVRADGSPAPGIKVFVFIENDPDRCAGGSICVVGEATTDQNGGYRIDKVLLGKYRVSAFTSDFTDGNITGVVVKFNDQVARADIRFRGGGGGRVVGSVFSCSGDAGVESCDPLNRTPLKARVSISGDQLVVAGGRVGVRWEFVQNFKIVDTDLTTGQFALSGLWLGPFTLRAAGQFSPDPISFDGEIPSPGATVTADLKLRSTSQVAGRVFQPDGVTSVGKDVVVRYKSDEFLTFCKETSGGETECETIPQGIQETSAVTDEHGRFLFPLVNAGTFTLTVEDVASGRIGRTSGSVKAGEKADVSVRLLALADVVVQVLASDGRTPIPGAEVVVEQLDLDRKDPKRKLTRVAGTQGTDAGVARFAGGDALIEGPFIVKATDIAGNGFAGRASGRVTQEGEPITIKVFVSDATGSVSGRVFRADRVTPAVNSEVVISGEGGALAFTIADADGGYSYDAIPVGGFTVEVFDPVTASHGRASGEIFVKGQHVTPLNVVEDPLSVVRGTVVEADTLAPLKGWRVTFNQQLASGRTIGLMTTTAADGSFSFPGASVGFFLLSASKPEELIGFGRAEATIARPGEVVDIPLVVVIRRPAFGRIEGLASNFDGTPAANAVVEFCAVPCSVPFANVTAGADGTFFLDHVPLGRVLVIARSQTTTDSGVALTEIAFEGDTARTQVVLAGLRRVSGEVVSAAGQPVTTASVVLIGIPGGRRDAFVDPATGRFVFDGLSARSFTVVATDPVSGLKGAASDVLTPGEQKEVRIVLEPTGSVTGRVLLSNGDPGGGIVGELAVNGRRLFAETRSDGSFSFDAAPVGDFVLDLEDPIGTGRARRFGAIAGAADLGDIILDGAAPAIASVTPPHAGVDVPIDSQIRIKFTEPVDPGSVSAASGNVALVGPTGPVAWTRTMAENDTMAIFTPVGPLATETRYEVRVKNVRDRAFPSEQVMAGEFVSTFTTVDLTPPSTVDLSPAVNTSGVSIESTIRLKFSEPIDTAHFRGPPTLTLTGVSGAPVDGRVDFILGNTVAVFTPNAALASDTVYRVQAPPARDLSGNAQPTGIEYTFATTDRTPPSVLGLLVSNDGKVVENGVAHVAAVVGATHDVLFVDFFLNDTFAATSRAPFELAFQATPALGGPGAQIKVSAIATDTSGNRGVPADTLVTVTPDLPPTATIVSPPPGASFKNGDQVNVVMRLTDDLGVRQASFKAETGKPQDAATRTISPASVDRTETFSFVIAPDAAPGAAIAIKASAVDTKGQAVDATPVEITVLDAIAPAVAITGTTTGDRVNPGQQTTVVVSAQDSGGVRSITFKASGAALLNQTRAIDPAQNAVVTSFTVLVPASAKPTESLRLDATATDRTGNAGTAAQIILPVADRGAPTVTLHTESGRLEIVRGRTFTVIARAEDELGVSRIELTGSGAFGVFEGRQISPPLAVGQASFTIAVPATAEPGGVLTLQARAFDFAGNASAPASLDLVVRALPEVVFPPSLLLRAGEAADVTVEISEPAPTAGTTVALDADAIVVAVPASVFFAEGETSKTISVFGVAGGTTFINGLLQGVQRGSMTVTVLGGIVRGTVLDQQFQPVAGASVTVKSGLTAVATETDADGRYSVQGMPFASVTVRVQKDIDPTTRLLGFASGLMNRANGFIDLNVVLMEAGLIAGTVRLPDGETLAGESVRVDLFEARNLTDAVATDFTDASGAYEFPLVARGDYVVEASDAAGNRGRASVSIVASGEERTVHVAYLGRGTVTGVVRDAFNNPVATATVTLFSRSVFGAAAPISRTVQPDGTFRFENVFVGDFTLQAKDPVTNQAATASGSIAAHEAEVEKELKLSSFGGLQGTVFRSDGETIVPRAKVTVHGIQTETDPSGRYSLSFLPLGPFSLFVRHESTRGIGLKTGTLTQPGVTETLDVKLFGQGALAVTVKDAGGSPVKGALLNVMPNNGTVSDLIFAATGDEGLAVVEHVLAGNFLVLAKFGSLVGRATGTLAEGETRPVLVELEPSASIAGTVFEPNGQTPTKGGTVWIDGQSISAPIGLDGKYRFDGLTLKGPNLGGYTLTAFDAQNRRRARVKQPIVLTRNGQVAEANMTWVGLGTVTGQVVNPLAPDASGGAGLTVQLRSLNPDFGLFRTMGTDAAGFYTIRDVPVGDFTVSVVHSILRLRGEGAGRIGEHDATVTVNLILQNNLIDLPVNRWDASNFKFDIQPNGSIRDGTSFVYAGQSQITTGGGLLLDVVTSGTPARFAGATVGTFEERGREIVLRQDGIGGLLVTRKVFVPSGGYFARYLEVFANPTEAPLTFDARVTSFLSRSFGSDRKTGIITTSSGDAALEVATGVGSDRWAVIDDVDDTDPFLLGGFPATAFVFDGSGGARAADVATFGDADPQIQLSPRRLVYEWSTVTVQPGETVAFLHFAVQQTSRAAAQASAERLEQLPPEALEGLSPEEIGQVRNFSVPADGASALAPLPALTGTVTGRVLAGDALTTVAGSRVRFRSGHVLFGRTYETTSNTSGGFSFSASFNDTGTSRAVPIDAFTLQADHPTHSFFKSPEAGGQFPPDATSTQQDVVFSNAGTLRGTIRLNGAPVAGATVSATARAESTTFNFNATSAADGSYQFPVVPAAVWTVRGVVVHQGTTVSATGVGSLAAGQSLDVSINIDTIAPQVTIASPAAGAPIDPRTPLQVVVNASDQGGLAETTFAASGAATAAETRAIAPPEATRAEVFTVRFEAPLPIGGSLTITVTAKDAAGNQTTATRTVSVLDIVPPEVTFITPANGVTEVDPMTAVVVQFSEPIDPASVSEATLRLARGETSIPVTYAFSNGNRTVTMTPVTRPLSLGATVTVTVGVGVKDAAGNALSALVTSTFTTKQPDVTPPRVAAIAPPHNAVDVPVATFIEVAFTEPVDPPTVTAASFRVSAGGSPVTGALTLLAGSTAARFTPAQPLPFGAVVITELTSAIADIAGNALVDAGGNPLTQPLTFTFLTASFGITKPARGEDVVENSQITLEARGSASLNIATVTFTANGQAVSTVGGPIFSTPFTVPSAATTTTLTIAAVARTSAGVLVAQDQVTVSVVVGLRVRPAVLGVPLGGSGTLRLLVSRPLAEDLAVTLTPVDPAIVTVPASVVLPAGETELKVQIGGAAEGATTVVATSDRGVAATIASVSQPVLQSRTIHAAIAALAVPPARPLGTVFTAIGAARTLDVPLLATPATIDTPVSISTTNAAVAKIDQAVVISAGAQTAPVTITSGVSGIATLTFRAAGEIRQLTVVVGTPPAGRVPPIPARPVGVVVLPAPSIGRLFTSPAGQSIVGVRILATPAASDTPVVVTSSDANVATVTGAVVIPAGSEVATLTISTGTAGTAKLRLAAAGEIRELTVVVGPPPDGSVPPIAARSVGVVVLPAPSVGRVFTVPAGQSIVGVRLLATPAAADTPVVVTSSDSNVATVTGSVVIPAGSEVATLTISTGTAGTAKLRLAAAGEIRELTVVVGPPPPGSVPPILAAPVGVVVLPAPSAGRVYSGLGAQPTVAVRLLASPATADTAVEVTSSNPNVATVSGAVVIPAGSDQASVTIATGLQGVATIRLRVGDSVRDLVVFVGNPPASLVPLITAPAVGVQVKQP